MKTNNNSNWQGTYMFDGAVNGWRNASLDSAKYSTEIEIGDRTNWLLPSIFPRLKKWGNDLIMRPVEATVGLFAGTKAKDPEPMPELPEAFRGNALGENLKKNYEQRCNTVIANAKSTQCMVNLDFSGMLQQEAVAVHEAALKRISLPENEQANPSVSQSGGTLLGGLVANAPAGSIGSKIRSAIH